MIEDYNRKSLRKIVSIILIVAILCATVIGDNYFHAMNLKGENNETTENDSVATEMNRLKPMEELTLAKTDTEVGKISETLQDGYKHLEEAYQNDDDFENAVDGFTSLVSDLKEQTRTEIDKTDNGTSNFQDYSSAVMSGYDELQEYTNELTGKDTETILKKIKDKVITEKPEVALGDDLPFQNEAGKEIALSDYVTTEESYEPQKNEYSEDDLKITNDTVINDDIREEFNKYDSALDIYEYIRNNILSEYYYGSRKGATGAFEQKAGNDYDVASLLIGILRDRNIPSRYVRAKIELTADQAMKWTATEDINVALREISALGIPATGLTMQGNIVAVQLEHVWVEAYVPYTDYRGTGNNSGDKLWIPLDPSFKEEKHIDGVNLNELSDYVKNTDNYITSETSMNGVNVGNLSTVVDGQNSALVKYMLENGYGEANMTEAFGGKEIVSEELGYLPMSLPYTVNQTIDTFDDIPESLTDSIDFSLVDSSDYLEEKLIDHKLSIPDIYGKRVILSYVPASEMDQQVIDKYGNIFNTPAYLIKLKPQLIVDGQVVAEGPECDAGYSQKYSIDIHNSAPNKNDEQVQNTVTVGGIYCIALDYGTISSESLQSSADSMESLKSSISENNIYTDASMGEMLNGIAKSYFAQLDSYNAIMAGQKNVTATRDLSIGIVGFGINVVYSFNRPVELNESGIFLDIGHDVHSVVSNTNKNDDEKAYMLQSGMYASAMEHGILEQMTGVESVSTIKVLEYAKAHDIPIHTIVKDNMTEELGKISVSDKVKDDIVTSVNAGRTIIIPEKNITLNQWTGVGYMVLDPDTFACGYMISGGLAGGSMTAGEMIGEYVTYVISGMIGIVIWEVLTTLILAMAPCGWIAAIRFIFMAAQFIMMINIVMEMIYLLEMYEATGDIYYLQELGVQVAALATLSIATKLLGNKLTKLKSKIAEAVDKAGLGGSCFIAGTLILASTGLIPIENVYAGDMVQSFDPVTQEVSQKQVEDTFVKESSELVHIKVANETITTTREHPFYTGNHEFVNAINLRAGDILCTVNGEEVIVEQVQHEILESPVKVYNFRVADNHTYYVSDTSIAVHNAVCPKPGEEKPFGNYDFKDGTDVDLRGGKGTYKDALDMAFEKTGVPKEDFEVTKWGYDQNGKSFPVEWRAENGAEVNIDLGHSPEGEAPTVPHVGYQSGGKRSSGGAVRGHIFVDDVPYNR